jgi:hypothetical protein
VYRSNGERAGRIERMMIDKTSGRVAYAVRQSGLRGDELRRFFGRGEDYYPLPWQPWQLLTYNPTLGGYELNTGEEQLKGAPKFAKSENWDWRSAAFKTKASKSIRGTWGARSCPL